VSIQRPIRDLIKGVLFLPREGVVEPLDPAITQGANGPSESGMVELVEALFVALEGGVQGMDSCWWFWAT